MHESIIGKVLQFVMVLACVLAASPATAQEAADPEAKRAVTGDYLGPGLTGPFVAEGAMVACSNHHAAAAGLETLRGGGNAVDAMAVMQFVLNVTEPHTSGIGGGLFMMMFEADTGEVLAYDGREEAPRSFEEDAFLDEDGRPIPFDTRRTGGNAVGVPGTLATVALVLEAHGTLTLAEAMQPAIRLARDGFIIDQPLARDIAEHAERLALYPATAALYLRGDGGPRQAGERIRNEDLARTLELIAEQGPDVFYAGEIGRDIVATVRHDEQAPGVLTMEDLGNYRPVRREPVVSSYRGHEVYGMNMPTSGGATLLLMLNILEPADLGAMGWGTPDAIHQLAEAQNLAFADRNAYMGDADFADVPVEALIDKAYAANRRAAMREDQALTTPVAPGRAAAHEPAAARPALRHTSTTHFVIVDEARNVISVTSTIEQHFGSAIVVPGRGFLLNNELTDFNAQPRDDEGNLAPNAAQGRWQPRRTALGEASQTRGGKRPRSSMNPTLVLKDGKPVMALGSPGGSRIIGITLNALVNVIDFDMDVQQAIRAPRIIGRNGPVELEATLGQDAALIEALEGRGFTVQPTHPFGSVQAIVIDADGRLHGGADPRRAGIAVGY